MRVVLDTNVLVAAFAARGLCEAVYESCLAAHEVFLSEYILAEAQRNLRRKLRMPSAEVAEIVGLLRTHATLVVPASVAAGACRDPDDRPVLGTAVAAGAEYLITGDRDLLKIGAFQSIPIVSPREFHDQVAGSCGS